MKPTKSITELLKDAVKKHGSLSEVSRLTSINRSTLKRIRSGKTKAPHKETGSRLLDCLYE